MATYTSAKTGLWSDTATWVGGVVPPNAYGDKIVVSVSSTATTRTTTTAGFAIGATSIAIQAGTGTLATGDSVQFGSNGTYYEITAGITAGAGNITITPGLVTAIPASATTVNVRGHKVTYDTTAGTYGDDTTSAITVNGTLYASRTATTSLTVRGDIVTAATIVACIDYGRKSVNDVIPNATPATIILNSSAAMANYKYGLFVADTSNAYFCGTARTRNTTITADIAIGATSAVVADATGWQVNDWVILAATNGTASNYDRRQITTITPGSGTTATITFAATTYAHVSGCPIGNFSSSVLVKSFNTTNPAYICFRSTSTTSNSRREFDNTSMEYIGSDVTLTNTKVFISTSNGFLNQSFVYLSNFSYYDGNFSVGLFCNAFVVPSSFKMENAVFIGPVSSGSTYYPASGTTLGLSNCLFIYSVGPHTVGSFSQGPQGVVYSNCKFWGTSQGFYHQSNGDGVQFNDCYFSTSSAITQGVLLLGSGSSTFNRCYIGSSQVAGTTRMQYVIDASSVIGSAGNHVFNDCYFGTPITSFSNRVSNANAVWASILANKNQDPSVQEIYTPNGVIVRDNTSKISGVTSLKLSPTSAINALTFTLQVPAPNGNLVGVSGKLNRDTANVATITLSGLGITPSVYTASGAINTNETFFVNGTNNTGTDGILILTISVTGTTGSMWVDAVSAPQAAAIDFGEFGYWANGLPASLVSASFTSAGDVWSYLVSNITTTGSIGVFVKKLLSVAKFLALK